MWSGDASLMRLKSFRLSDGFRGIRTRKLCIGSLHPPKTILLRVWGFTKPSFTFFADFIQFFHIFFTFKAGKCFEDSMEVAVSSSYIRSYSIQRGSEHKSHVKSNVLSQSNWLLKICTRLQRFKWKTYTYIFLFGIFSM